MTPELIDELLEALMADACARGADRVAVFEQGALGLRNEEELLRQPLDWRVTGALVRRAMLGAGLDPWQFRRTQTGTLAGRWELTVEGEDQPRRRLTIRPREPMTAAREGAAGRLQAIVEKLRVSLTAEAARVREEPSETELLTADDSPVVKLVNLMMKDAVSLGVSRIVASAAVGQLTYPDGRVGRELAWPQHLWPEIRGRLLFMCGLQPWDRGPQVSGFRLRFYDGRFASWRVEVSAGDGPLVLTLEDEPAPRAEEIPPPSGQPPPVQSPLSPPLRAVLDAPDDLNRRAVYADWLLERSDPRGRFIALQLAGRAAPAPPAQLGEWCGALRELVSSSSDVRFGWGFVDRLVVTRRPDAAQLSALAGDPHWATVRALKLRGISPRVAGRILQAGPLASLIALGLEAPPEPAVAAVLARLGALSVTNLDLAFGEWLDQAELPRLTSLELELEDHLSTPVAAEKLRRFLALRPAQSARDLVVDWLAHGALWPHLATLPASVERVSLPFVTTPRENFYLTPREQFPEALLCTLQHEGVGAGFTHAIVSGEVDALYRSAGDVLTALAGCASLEVVRLVSRPRAFDRGREAILRKTCAAKLPRAKVEVSVGEPLAPLWWLAETPPR